LQTSPHIKRAAWSPIMYHDNEAAAAHLHGMLSG